MIMDFCGLKGRQKVMDAGLLPLSSELGIQQFLVPSAVLSVTKEQFTFAKNEQTESSGSDLKGRNGNSFS